MALILVLPIGISSARAQTSDEAPHQPPGSVVVRMNGRLRTFGGVVSDGAGHTDTYVAPPPAQNSAPLPPRFSAAPVPAQPAR